MLSCILLFSMCYTGSDFVDCDRGATPTAPYGTPDDTYTYTSGTYESLSFVYYCYNGQYIDVTYISEDACSDWYKDSEFVTDGICKSLLLQEKFKEEKLLKGYKLIKNKV